MSVYQESVAPTVQRPVRLIQAIAVVQALSYVVVRDPPELKQQTIGWALLNAYLIWRVWQGGRVAREVLLGLNVVTIGLMLLVASGATGAYTGQGPVRGVLQFTLVVVAVVLLLRPRLRDWVESGR